MSSNLVPLMPIKSNENVKKMLEQIRNIPLINNNMFKTSFDIIMLCIPFIIAIGLMLLSVFNRSVTGFIFVLSFLGVTIFRWILTKIPSVNVKDTSFCNLGGFDFNSSYSLYAMTFILFYLLIPMIQNDDMNWWAIGTILFCLTIDILYRSTKKCYTQLSWSNIMINTTGGMLMGILVPFIIYSLNRPEWLYFNEMSSNKNVCSMPKKTKFKCNVYKNGELVSTMNK